MLRSDRIFGLVMIVVALGYILSAFQIQTSFMADPVGAKTFPVAIALVAILCSIIMILKPDEEPDWPEARTLMSLALAVVVMTAYAYALKPLGFLIPTAIAAGVLSWQISERPGFAAITGLALSGGLYVIFKFVFGLGLQAVPKAWLG
jgi:putative tricarboxylic transport membrane protein